MLALVNYNLIMSCKLKGCIFINEQVLYWLSGLTCTDENFITKSGAQRAASSEGVALIAPDTSPSK